MRAPEPDGHRHRKMGGDFLSLLPENPLLRAVTHDPKALDGHRLQATTVLAFHYSQGVLMAGDHRATADNLIYSDRVEKILPLDGESIMAVAGSPAVAFEMARTLETSFEFYRRSQLQTMSLQAKARALSQLLKENLPVVLQGVGAVIPIFAGIDRGPAEPEPVIFFFDPLGAQFESSSFAASGSGSLNAKSVLGFLENWGSPSPREMDLNQAAVLALRLLNTSASLDSATGGVDPPRGRFATLYSLQVGQVRRITDAEQETWWQAASS